MLKRSFFCTFFLLIVYHVSCCNLSPVFVCYYFIHSSRENCFNCSELIELSPLTGGHFACACVNPLNNNSVDASNLMAGNRKLARKVAGLLKAISLVLWIPYFPTIGRFLRGFSLLDFSAVGFLGLLKTFKTPRQKVMFLYKSDFHCKAMHFYGLISELVVLLMREEMHCSNVQLLN